LPDTAQKAEDVAVDPVPLGPQLDRPEREPKILHIRHLPQYLVRDAATVQAAHTLRIQVLQQERITQILRLGDLFERESRKGQIDVDPVKAELDDGHEGVRDGAQVGHLVAHAQMLDKAGEVVVAENVTRRHAEGVNVGAFVVDAEAVGAEGVDFAANGGGDILRHTLLYAHVLQSGRYFLLDSFFFSVANPDPGSGAFLTPGSGMGKKSGSESGMNNQDLISEILETTFRS
jgi:hypothetical protein